MAGKENDISPVVIEVHPNTKEPQKAWAKIKAQVKVKDVQPVESSKWWSDKCVRFVCVSDTHVRLEKKKSVGSSVIPDGDVLLHTGDFSMRGWPEEISLFNTYFGSLKHRVKLLIAGNHDMTLDPKVNSHDIVKKSRDLLTTFTYLEDSFVTVYGIKIFGAPWVPTCGCWGFTLSRGRQLLDHWNLIPNDVDILMTHGPPIGYGDKTLFKKHVGCVELLNTVQRRIKPKYHVYGHIHEGYGMRTDGQTVFINASVCSKHYKPVHKPIVFDYPLPEGHTKDEILDLAITSVTADANK
ncbi:metallophosphoesterase MPPED2-like isoform X2 [Gigantopelta aegis]|nr:metallophosphoesterase MPPED2-like isoform X2 [Gigantopelta aegis]